MWPAAGIRWTRQAEALTGRDYRAGRSARRVWPRWGPRRWPCPGRPYRQRARAPDQCDSAVSRMSARDDAGSSDVPANI
jgi:hypothetical protein